jgi:hypothetical protein
MDSSFEVIRSVERDAQQSIADSRREASDASRHTVTYGIDLTTKPSAREGFTREILNDSIAVMSRGVRQTCMSLIESLLRLNSLVRYDSKSGAA